MTNDAILSQVAEQKQSSKQPAAEEELRRSIEARMSERVKEEKLKLSKKALELGKQKVGLPFAFTAHLSCWPCVFMVKEHHRHVLTEESFLIFKQRR